jgi:hypothetical protein
VVAFCDYYDLTSMTFKQLDKFMYRSGDRIIKLQKGQTDIRFLRSEQTISNQEGNK